MIFWSGLRIISLAGETDRKEVVGVTIAEQLRLSGFFQHLLCVLTDGNEHPEPWGTAANELPDQVHLDQCLHQSR